MSKLITGAKWDPFFKMGEDFESFVNAILPTGAFTVKNAQNFNIDISDDGKGYYITSDLPGIEKEDIKIELKGDYLTIEAEKKDEKEEENKRYYRRERSYGKFSRAVLIPEDAEKDIGKIEAEFKNGVLKIKMNKIESVKDEGVKRVEIK